MKKLFTVLFFVLFIQTISSAQLLSTSSSFGARYVMPVGDIADFYDGGWGLTGTGYFSVIPLVDILVEGSWHSLAAKELTTDDILYGPNDLSIMGFTAGARVNLLGLVGIGLKGGYFFDDIHEWAIQPFAEISFLMLSVGAEYRMGEDVDWAAFYLNVNL